MVKVFCHEDKSLEDFRKVNGNLMDSARKANTYGNILMPVIAQLGNVSYVVCAVVGAALALNGYTGLTLGMLVSFLTLNKNFNQPFAQVSQQINSVVMAMAGIGRIFELMDEEPEKDEGYVQLVNAQRFPDGSVTETEKRTGLWAWKHYHKADNTTTYVELKGDIVLDGVDFGYTDDKMVLQDTHLFTGTIMENIRYGKLDATDEECIAAAKLSNADGFIRMLPEGYDTVITGDGGSLSQGQRQLLAIARAAVADPPVLILDEATSSIDTHTEELVQKGMDSLMRGRTAFVIAHRLRTIEGCDSVYQLRDGKIMNIRQEVLQD